MTTGDKIRSRRKELGISAEALAKKIGVSRSTMFRYENGYIEKVPASMLGKLSDALQTTPAFLLGIPEQSDVAKNIRHYGQSASPKLRVLFSRSRALSDKQLDIVNSIVAEMVKEQEPYDD